MSVPLSKHQSGLGFGIIVAGGRAADEHGGATVPAEGVLKDAGHFAITVGHMSFLKGSGGAEKNIQNITFTRKTEKRSCSVLNYLKLSKTI